MVLNVPAGQKYPAAQSLVQGEGCPMTLDHFPGAQSVGDVAASKQKRPAGHCPEQMGVVSATVSPNRPALQLLQKAAPPTL